MRTLFNENSKHPNDIEYMTDASALSYRGITSRSNSSGMLSALSLPWAISQVAGEAAETVGDVMNWMFSEVGAMIGPSDAMKDFIESLPQYSFETDLDGNAWNPIFNPHPELGLKSSGIAGVFYASLIGAKFAPMIARTGFKAVGSLNKFRKARNLKGWRPVYSMLH